MVNPVLATSVIPVSMYVDPFVSFTDVLSSMMVFVPKIAGNLKNVALLLDGSGSGYAIKLYRLRQYSSTEHS